MFITVVTNCPYPFVYICLFEKINYVHYLFCFVYILFLIIVSFLFIHVYLFCFSSISMAVYINWLLSNCVINCVINNDRIAGFKVCF